MAYVIAQPCIGVKDTACVTVCPADCIHPTKEFLGSDGMAEFYRCHACERVIVVQGTRSWAIRPSPST